MSLLDSIKKNEGFSPIVYKDHLGLDTIGYGTLMPLTKTECELLLNHRLKQMKTELLLKKPIITKLDDILQDVLYEMAYQLGVPRLLKFKNMWEAVKENNIENIQLEMKDSKWYGQTTNRVEELINKLNKLKVK